MLIFGNIRNFHAGSGSDISALIAAVDAPAYMRRGQAVDAAWHAVLSNCRQMYTGRLRMPRMRLNQLLAVLPRGLNSAGELPVSGEGDHFVRHLQAALAQTINLSPAVSDARDQLQRSVERFNVWWQKQLSEIDLSEVNRLRQAYNDYYVLEMECAGVSATVARRSFQRKRPATVHDLLREFPLLPLPGDVTRNPTS